MKTFKICIVVFCVFIGANTHAFKNTIIDSPVVLSASSNKNIFPKSWRSTRINANATPLAKSEYKRSKIILSNAFSKYPKSLLIQHLDTVYIVQNLSFRGVSAGGTNSLRNVYLANKGVKHGYTNKAIERIFHAEFSSILLRNFSQYIREHYWKKLNPAGFEYSNDGVDAIKNNTASERMTEKIMKWDSILNMLLQVLKMTLTQ